MLQNLKYAMVWCFCFTTIQMIKRFQWRWLMYIQGKNWWSSSFQRYLKRLNFLSSLMIKSWSKHRIKIWLYIIQLQVRKIKLRDLMLLKHLSFCMIKRRYWRWKMGKYKCGPLVARWYRTLERWFYAPYQAVLKTTSFQFLNRRNIFFHLCRWNQISMMPILIIVLKPFVFRIWQRNKEKSRLETLAILHIYFHLMLL